MWTDAVQLIGDLEAWPLDPDTDLTWHGDHING